MKIEYFLRSAVSFVFLSVVVISCSKQQNSPAAKGQLQVYLSDDPADYDNVIIDVKDVQINVTGDSTGGWQSLSTVNAGTYDLLKLVNDHDTLLAHSDIPTGMIHQMRLILGDNNYVVVNGRNIPLKTPSAQESGLKFNIQLQVTSGILYKITLDFDAAKSIVKTGNDKYLLKPVIRTVLSAVGGSIKGFVLPDSVTTAIYVIQAPDTIASTFSSNGGYLIKGLAAGLYTLSFVPNDTSYTAQTKTGIAVTTGNVTMVDTVHLHH